MTMNSIAITISTLALALLGVGCGPSDPIGDDEIGDTSTSESSTSESSTSESGSSESSSADSSDSSATTTTSETTTDSTTDSSSETTTTSDTTGDPSCEGDSYIGEALADDPWGVGSLCDEIWVCADETQVPLLQAAVPSVMCVPGNGCPVSHCTISYSMIVDAASFALVCDALSVPGIDAAYCIVYGP